VWHKIAPRTSLVKVSKNHSPCRKLSNLYYGIFAATFPNISDEIAQNGGPSQTPTFSAKNNQEQNQRAL